MVEHTGSLSDRLRVDKAFPDDFSFTSSSTAVSELNTQGVDAHIVWSKGTELLRNHLDKQIFSAWIEPLSIAGVEFSNSLTDTNALVTLLAPNKFCCDHVQRHYGTLISSTLNEVIGSGGTQLTFKVSDPSAISRFRPKSTSFQTKSSSGADGKQKTWSDRKRTAPARSRGQSRVSSRPDQSNLNPKYNFSNFVVGGCNQFAHAVGVKVAEDLGATYNPLFIYGGVGLGKTHLANAIGNASRRRNNKVLLISSEAFVSDLISSLRTNNMPRFKDKFRSLDMLIIDDIQFIMGKERTQEEFFHTFNELHNRQKQIIVTSDKLPAELTGLEERLRTRFASGLSADLQKPDFETRVAILTKKSEIANVVLPDSVARLLAERIKTNVRELEGALNRLCAFCSLHNTEPNMTLAEEVLKSLAPERKTEISTQLIQKTVASIYNVSINDILGKRRTHNIAFARQVAMYLCRQLTGCSYPEIGAVFGGRDHSTVIHAKKVISQKIEQDLEFQTEIEKLKVKLRS